MWKIFSCTCEALNDPYRAVDVQLRTNLIYDFICFLINNVPPFDFISITSWYSLWNFYLFSFYLILLLSLFTCLLYFILSHTHTHTHTRARTHTHIYIYIYIYICIFIHLPYPLSLSLSKTTFMYLSIHIQNIYIVFGK